MTGVYEKVALLFVAEVPAGPVTVTLTTPAPAGEVAVKEDPPGPTVTLVAWACPNCTVDPWVNPEPVMVTEVPPLAGPPDGEMEVTAGT